MQSAKSNSPMRIEEHLFSRNINPAIHDYVVDEEEGVATFFFWNLSENMVGFQQYRPYIDKKKKNNAKEGRYFTYMRSGYDAIWGLDVYPLDCDLNTLYVVEGIFKAAKLHKLGKRAIAVSSNNPKRLRPWFSIMKATHNVIAIGDHGRSGSPLVNMVGRGFQTLCDVDEMEDEDLNRMLLTVR